MQELILSVGVWLAYMPARHMHVWYPQEPRESVESSGTGSTDGYEPPIPHLPTTWVLGMEPEASARAESVLNRGAISPAPHSLLLIMDGICVFNFLMLLPVTFPE